MNLIPNIVATITLITISYGCMQYIPVKFPNSQPMIRKKSAQQMVSTDEYITKIKSLHEQGFKKDNVNDKKGREKKKKNGNGKLKRIEKGNEKVKGSMNEKGNKKVKGLIIIIQFLCFQCSFSL